MADLAEKTKAEDYWMGQVDVKLEMIAQLLSAQAVNWEEFRTWRDSVNVRLTQGNSSVESILLRLSALEAEIKVHTNSIMLNANSALIMKEIHALMKEHVGNKDIHGINKNEFITWPWILEKLLVPLIQWGLLTFIAYLLVNKITLG